MSRWVSGTLSISKIEPSAIIVNKIARSFISDVAGASDNCDTYHTRLGSKYRHAALWKQFNEKNDVDDHIPMTTLLPPDPPLFNVCIHPHFKAIS